MRGALLMLLAALALMAAPGGASAARSCRDEIGPKRSAELVRQCTVVSPATRPPCNATNACALIRSEIRHGCEILGTDAPAFCRSAIGEDDEDDDEDDDQ